MKKYVSRYTRKKKNGWGGTLLLALAVLLVLMLYVMKTVPGLRAAEEGVPEESPESTSVLTENAGAEITETVAFPEITVYCVAVGSYGSEEEAKEDARTIQNLSGAGLIVPNNGAYSVLVAAYFAQSTCKEQAEALARTKEWQTETVSLTVPAVEMKLTATPERIDGIRDAYGVWQQSIQLLNDLWQALDGGECASQQALERMKTQNDKMTEAMNAAFSNALLTGEVTVLDGFNTVMENLALQQNKLLLETDVKPLELSAKIKYNLLVSLMEAKSCMEGL